jgi:Tol biopolymer transport system component
MKIRLLVLPSVLLLAACRSPAWVERPQTEGERRLANVRQLTFGGDNAEAYWSWGGDQLIFQMSRRKGPDGRMVPCDQIFIIGTDGHGERMVSSGKGRTTCPYFLPGDDRIVYASTHHVADECPNPPPAVQGGYTWPLFDYDVYVADADGSNVQRLIGGPGYDAEPTAAPDGTIVFTSDRDGDLELYTMNSDGSDVRRLTNALGYDGGAFFSADGSKIVYRSYHPQKPEEVETYKRLLAARWVQPSKMQICVMDRDGSNQRQVTNLPGTSFAPFFHPDGKRIIFASNWEDPRGWKFDLWIVNVDGTGLEKVTSAPEFDAFPMFSPDGKQLVWESNRFNDKAHERDTNIFIADWVE